MTIPTTRDATLSPLEKLEHFLANPVNFIIMSWIVLKLRLGKLPKNASRKHIAGLGFLGGIGFTMPIFIALLSFKDPVQQAESKFAVLITSTVSGAIGFLLLRSINRQKVQKPENTGR